MFDDCILPRVHQQALASPRERLPREFVGLKQSARGRRLGMCIVQLSAIQTDINKGRGSANNLIAERVALFGLARPPRRTAAVRGLVGGRHRGDVLVVTVTIRLAQTAFRRVGVDSSSVTMSVFANNQPI